MGTIPSESWGKISVTGTFDKGGYMDVEKGESKRRFALSLPLFVVLERLITLAKRSDPEELEGFSIEELRKQMIKMTRFARRPLDPEPEHVVRYVHRLRKLLGKVGDREWAAEVIQWVNPVGYRIALPPEMLRLRIQRDLSTPAALEEPPAPRAFPWQPAEPTDDERD